jgi:hypothetical protein
LETGARSRDIARSGESSLSTEQMGTRIKGALLKVAENTPMVPG